MPRQGWPQGQNRPRCRRWRWRTTRRSGRRCRGCLGSAGWTMRSRSTVRQRRRCPRRVQALGEAQDTLLSCAPPVPGVGGIDHEVPFHASTSGELLLSPPTAMQEAAERQDTPVRKLPKRPVGRGLDGPGGAVPALGQRHRVTPEVVHSRVAHGRAGAGRRAGHRGQGTARRGRGVGRGLAGPCGAVPALGQRDVFARPGLIAPHGGARRGRRAGHAVEEAAAGPGGGGAGMTDHEEPFQASVSMAGLRGSGSSPRRRRRWRPGTTRRTGRW